MEEGGDSKETSKTLKNTETTEHLKYKELTKNEDFPFFSQKRLKSDKSDTVNIISCAKLGPKKNQISSVGIDPVTDEVPRFMETLEVKENYLDTMTDIKYVLEDKFNDKEMSFRSKEKVCLNENPSCVGVRERQQDLSMETAEEKFLCLRDADQSVSKLIMSENVVENGVENGVKEGVKDEVENGAENGVKDGVENGVVCDTDSFFEERLQSAKVVGTKRVNGEVCLAGRVVGVKDHTVYRIKVKGLRGEWMVERRFRHFVTLYYKLLREIAVLQEDKLDYRNNNFVIPESWHKIPIESNNFFGNNHEKVIERRSLLLQRCLQASFLEGGNDIFSLCIFVEFFSPSWEGLIRESYLSRDVFSTWSQNSKSHYFRFDFQETTNKISRSSEDNLSKVSKGSCKSKNSTRDFRRDCTENYSFNPGFDTTTDFSEFDKKKSIGTLFLVPPLSDTEKRERYLRDFMAGSASLPMLGQRIQLVLEVKRQKPLIQQLHVQFYRCGGCFRALDSLGTKSGIVSGIKGSLGMGGPSYPRFCEYTGKLYCGICHIGEMAIIPAWVLHFWDFQPRRVSRAVKMYLDVIYDQPLLSVNTVYPSLYLRVPLLSRVQILRKHLSFLWTSLNCEEGPQLLSDMGVKQYLLLNNDFFALQELVDLSLGPFSVVPKYLERLAFQLQCHVTKTCDTCLSENKQNTCDSVSCEDVHSISPNLKEDDSFAPEREKVNTKLKIK